MRLYKIILIKPRQVNIGRAEVKFTPSENVFYREIRIKMQLLGRRPVVENVISYEEFSPVFGECIIILNENQGKIP